MQISHQRLSKSRLQYVAKVTALEVDEFYQQAVARLSAGVKITGFRPGKAPLNLVRDQLKPEALREEAYTLAVQSAWLQVATELKESPIHDPAVEVGNFSENQPAEITYTFDVRPEVTVKNWEKINLSKVVRQPVDASQTEEIITSLQKAHAKTVVTLEPAQIGDKVEVSFTGSLKGVTKDKLSSKHFPLVLGEQSVIPGFAEEIIGLKKGETKKFRLTFPKDHFDKELAGQLIDFEATIDDVYKIELPAVDDELAKKFGHDTLKELKAAIATDVETRHDEEFKVQQKAEWLAEFDKCITVELPQSLVEAEVGRSRAHWEDFLQKRHLNREDWLARQKTSIEELEKGWQKAAESSVRIGLGLAKLAEEQKKPLRGNDDYQAFLDTLVASAASRVKK